MLYRAEYKMNGPNGSYNERQHIVYIEGKSWEEVRQRIKTQLESEYRYFIVEFDSLTKIDGVIWKD